MAAETKKHADSKFKYGYWRTDKEKEPGYSHELISCDSVVLEDRGATLDTLEATPPHGGTTLLDGLRRNVARIPNNDFLGTRVGDEYKWMSFREVGDITEHLSYGLVHHGLAPAREFEGREWKFIGI